MKLLNIIYKTAN